MKMFIAIIVGFFGFVVSAVASEFPITGSTEWGEPDTINRPLSADENAHFNLVGGRYQEWVWTHWVQTVNMHGLPGQEPKRYTVRRIVDSNGGIVKETKSYDLEGPLVSLPAPPPPPVQVVVVREPYYQPQWQWTGYWGRSYGGYVCGGASYESRNRVVGHRYGGGATYGGGRSVGSGGYVGASATVRGGSSVGPGQNVTGGQIVGSGGYVGAGGSYSGHSSVSGGGQVGPGRGVGGSAIGGSRVGSGATYGRRP